MRIQESRGGVMTRQHARRVPDPDTAAPLGGAALAVPCFGSASLRAAGAHAAVEVVHVLFRVEGKGKGKGRRGRTDEDHALLESARVVPAGRLGELLRREAVLDSFGSQGRRRQGKIIPSFHHSIIPARATGEPANTPRRLHRCTSTM